MEERKSYFWYKVILFVSFIVLALCVGYFIGRILTKCDSCEKVSRDSKAYNIGENTINGQRVVYDIYAVDNIMGIQVVSNDDQKSVSIDIYKEVIDSYFNIDIDSDKSIVTSFDSRLINVFIGYFGQGVGQEYLLFLLEDGTLEYIPIYKEVLSNGTFKSHGKIVGISDVIGFVYLTVDKNSSGYYSVGAVRSDGTVYDLMEFIDKMN